MEKTGMCGVYRLFKLGKGVGNTFSKEYKKIERDLHVVTHDYADLINLNSSINGSLYEYDENASKLYWSKKPYENTSSVIEKAPEEVIDVEADDLKYYQEEYEKLSGKKAHHLWKTEKLIEKIEELNK
jgi:hypothetical protein